MKAPIDNKFVPYGGPDLSVDTEVRGEIVEAGSELLIVPDSNYFHMCRPGNLRHPQPGEAAGSDQCYEAAREARIRGRPVIKCELYQVGSRPDPSGGTTQPPTVSQGGVQRPIQNGDRVRLRGLYVTDNSHSMYCEWFTPSFIVMRGLYEAGYVHTEIHPYDYSAIDLLDELPSADQLAESHTFVSPIYPEVYTSTYFWNKLWGVAGNLVDDAKETAETASFIVRGAASSGAGYDRLLVMSNVVQIGSPPSISYQPSGASDLAVQVQITGTDVLNPSLYRATFAVQWVPVMNVSYSPDPIPVNTPISMMFGATAARDGSALSGSPVLFNGQQVGVTGTPFNYTFPSHYVVVMVSGNGKPHPVRVRVGPNIAMTVHHDGYEDFHIVGLHYSGVSAPQDGI